MNFELSLSNYNPDVNIDMSRWYLRLVSDLLSEYFFEVDSSNWIISVEICGSKKTVDLVYDSKTNRYRTYYFYLFATDRINLLSQKEKELYIIDLLFDKLYTIRNHIKIKKEFHNHGLELVKKRILLTARDPFFRLEYDSNEDENYYLDLLKNGDYVYTSF